MAEQISFGGDEVDGGLDPLNVQPRCACLLVLDVSGSMGGSPITELNAGLRVFQDELRADQLAMQRVEVGILTFGPVQIEMPFHSAETFVAPTLAAQGNTPMGAAVLQAIDMIRQRKEDYKATGLPYYKPWIFLITDGAPDSNDPWLAAADAVRQGEAAKAFSFFAIGVQGANMETLGKISAARPPMSLQGLKFRELFAWLSASMKQVSKSSVGSDMPLPTPAGWGSVST
jgi:uncharacterized protein YegL